MPKNVPDAQGLAYGAVISLKTNLANAWCPSLKKSYGNAEIEELAKWLMTELESASSVKHFVDKHVPGATEAMLRSDYQKFKKRDIKTWEFRIAGQRPGVRNNSERAEMIANSVALVNP